MKKKIKKIKAKSIKIDPVYSFYNDVEKLHAKVKAQEATLLEQQTIINSLSARMEALETGQSPVTGFVSGVDPNNN